MYKADQLKEAIGICFKVDNLGYKGWPLKETATNLGLYFLLLLVVILHVVLGILQLAASLVQTGCDLIANGLVKIMPAPKGSEAKQ